MAQRTGYAVDRSNDHKVIDGVVEVEVTSADNEFAGGTARARRGALTKAEVSGGVAGISANDTVWNVWKSTLGEATLEVDGEIKVGSDRFTILSLVNAADDSQVRCFCRQQVQG